MVSRNRRSTEIELKCFEIVRVDLFCKKKRKKNSGVDKRGAIVASPSVESVNRAYSHKIGEAVPVSSVWL